MSCKVAQRNLFCISISIFIISVRSQCGADLTTESGVITSPRFPSSYPDEANCEWKIAVDGGSRITLTFVMFEVQNSKLITRGEMALNRHETQQFISFRLIHIILRCPQYQLTEQTQLTVEYLCIVPTIIC